MSVLVSDIGKYSLSVQLDGSSRERRESRPERSGVHFSLDPVAKMGRPARQKGVFWAGDLLI